MWITVHHLGNLRNGAFSLNVTPRCFWEFMRKCTDWKAESTVVALDIWTPTDIQTSRRSFIFFPAFFWGLTFLLNAVIDAVARWYFDLAGRILHFALRFFYLILCWVLLSSSSSLLSLFHSFLLRIFQQQWGYTMDVLFFQPFYISPYSNRLDTYVLPTSSGVHFCN